MKNEELLISLQLEELTREHPQLKPIHDLLMLELAEAAEKAAEELKKKLEEKAKKEAEKKAKADEEAKVKEEPKGNIHTSSNPTMADHRRI